ncbi:MAG TPA: site-2 protease family protein [Candidatus Acidoferrales bacterium]|nr:site-2 protease family protein [Candidatus Acidoferrales bacterium]
MNQLESDRFSGIYRPQPFPPVVAARQKRIPLIHIVLFAMTFVTTALAGAFNAGANPLSDPASIRAGFPFAVTLLSILLVHELGHYTLARVHNVSATLPYFIPGPPILIGTFGAFIRLKSLPESRRALFDVGAAGPWAGLMVAIPAVLIGLHFSEVRPAGMGDGGLLLGDSMLFKFLSWVALGVSSDDVTIMLHPVALAGWIGLFVTVLNLLPIGQLDGGHVAYAMFGRRHRWIARIALVIIGILAYTSWPGWFVWVILPLMIGVDHPPTLEDYVPIRGWRRIGGWLTVAVFILLFTPAPFTESKPAPEFEGEKTPVTYKAPQESSPFLKGGPRGIPL